MKQQRQYPTVTVTPKGERSLAAGHPWVYDAEVVSVQPAPPAENGSLVDVITLKGKYVGTGFYSEKSKIRVRIVSRNANDRFDEAFWRRRVQYAWDYRCSVLKKEELSCCRVVFGEADFLPGLTVDKFGSVLVTQTLCVGIERIKPVLFLLLAQVLEEAGETITGIFERNDVALRQREGLSEGKGWFALPGKEIPNATVTHMTENGVKYLVDFENGQKTGFFLDQKYNRQAVAQLARGKKVLDCFTHTGSFALNAALGGAEKVTAVDVSQQAVELARQNAELNGLADKMEFLAANVFDLLPKLEEKGGHPYDFIILDPPAFTKSRKTIDSAMRGYKEINLRAMKLLPRGGYLATCSCSHFASEELFCKMLRSAAKDAGVELRQIEARQQSADHPILWNVDETNYLKFYLFQVV